MTTGEMQSAEAPESVATPDGRPRLAGVPLSLRGVATAYTPATTQEPGTITVGGLPFPLAPGTVLAGDSIEPGLQVNLDARLDAAGRIAEGVVKRAVLEEEPSWLPFWLQLIYLILLIGGALIYHTSSQDAIVKQLHAFLIALFPDPTGPIPLVIPWFGALGSVTRGLANSYGEVDLIERSPYRPRHYNTLGWYIARPFIGAAFGIFVFVFFLTVLDPTGNTKPGGEFGIDILAFIVGYADGTFAALVQRAINVLLGPGDAAAGGTQTGHAIRADND